MGPSCRCAGKLDARAALVPLGRALVHARDAQELVLGERGAEQLEPDREGPGAAGEAAGDADAGDGGDVAGDGEDVGEVHLERVAALLADLERGRRRSGGDDDVALLKR